MGGEGRRGRLGKVALLVALCACIGVAWWLRRQGLLAPDLFERRLALHPVAAAILFVVAYAISVLTLIPTLPLNLAAGVFWGSVFGGLIATGGAVLGTIGAFYAARGLFGRPLARRFSSDRVAWLQREFEAKGWRFIAFIRLNPALPTGPINYVLGLTSIDAFTYVWATAVFLLPPTFVVALIGHEMGSFIAKGAVADLIEALITVSAAAVALAVMWYAARALNQRRFKSR